MPQSYVVPEIGELTKELMELYELSDTDLAEEKSTKINKNEPNDEDLLDERSVEQYYTTLRDEGMIPNLIVTTRKIKPKTFDEDVDGVDQIQLNIRGDDSGIAPLDLNKSFNDSVDELEDEDDFEI